MTTAAAPAHHRARAGVGAGGTLPHLTTGSVRRGGGESRPYPRGPSVSITASIRLAASAGDGRITASHGAWMQSPSGQRRRCSTAAFRTIRFSAALEAL